MDFGLRNTSFQAPLLLARLRHLVTPIVGRTSSICSFQRIQLSFSPTLADPCIKYPCRWSVVLHSTWPSQCSCRVLIRCTTSMSLRSSYSSLLDQTRKSLPTPTGLVSRVLSRLLHHCLIGSMPLRHKEAHVGWASCRVLVLRTREVCVTQLPTETIVAPVANSDPSLDLQADIIFGGNGRAKINKFLDYIKSIGRNLRINT